MSDITWIDALDVMEAAMVRSGFAQVECPLEHSFIPGFYVRTIRMPAGFMCTSKIHKTRHPYWVTEGRVRVWTDSVGLKVIEAPFVGITEAGTRRLLYCETDVVWTTFHATQKTTVEEVEAEIIEPHMNPFPEVSYVDAFGKIVANELESGVTA